MTRHFHKSGFVFLGILVGILACFFILRAIPTPIILVLRQFLFLSFLTVIGLVFAPPWMFCSGLFVFGLITIKPDKFVWHHILLILPAVPSIFVLFWAALNLQVGNEFQCLHNSYMNNLNQVVTYTTFLLEAAVLSTIRLLGVKGKPFLFAISAGIFQMGLATIAGFVATPRIFTIVP